MQSFMNEEDPIDSVLNECIDIGNEAHGEGSFKDVDDPHLRIISIIVNKSFEKLYESDNQLGDAARNLFWIMTFLDPDYLFKEIFKGITDDTKKISYTNGMDALERMGIVKYENR